MNAVKIPPINLTNYWLVVYCLFSHPHHLDL